MVSYVALKDNNYVYNNLRNLTLMGILRQERGFALANYVTTVDCLKVIFRASGLEKYAYDCGEDLVLRQSLGVPDGRPYSTSDGFFIAAYQLGLISQSHLDSYFANKPGYTEGDYAIRQDVVLWLSHLFEIAQSEDFSQLSKYPDFVLLSPRAKADYAGVLKAGITIAEGGKLSPYKPLKYSEFVTLLTRFYPYLLKANGIETYTAHVENALLDENENLSVILSNGDIIKSQPDNTCILAGKNYMDNSYALLDDKYKGTIINYYVSGSKLIFISTNTSMPQESYGASVSGEIYFYNDLTGSLVYTEASGKYREYYLAEDAEIIIGGEKSTPEKLMEYTDYNFTGEVLGISKYSLGRIVRLEIK